jgi:iron complex outermembrane recepter protein
MNLKQVIIPLAFLPMTSAMAEHIETEKLDDLIITTGHKLFPNTLLATPTYKITEGDIEKVNATTIEDAVMQAPSVFVRRRFIGDTNGTTGIRGSSYFQTAHTMVFSDGLRLHNMLQTVWNGAPRWSLVAPNSVKQVKVMYGPYSAEHSGNSFGGTIEMTTKMPEEFGMDMEVMGMVQDSHRFGRDEVLTGHKEFISAGNKIGKWSVYGFYNHLENEGQPQSFDADAGEGLAGGETAVTGAYKTTTNKGVDTYILGDQGVQESTYDLFEVKVGYDFTPDLTGLLTIAYEDVEKDRKDGMSFLKDANGNQIWEQSTNLSYNGKKFNVDESDYGRNLTTRETLTYGYNLSGKINDEWEIDTTAEFFDGFKDTNTAANQSTNNANYDKSGTVTDTERWWGTYDLKLATQELMGRKDIGAMFGYQWNYSDLQYGKYTSTNVEIRSRDTFASRAGGATSMNSAFGQADWDFLPDWNVMAGARYDYWETIGGHFTEAGVITPFDDRSSGRVSPKFSLAFAPNDLSFRYSFSKAYRFPMAQELYDNVEDNTTDSSSVSDPGLGPETGYFHDFKVQYDLPEGYARASLFYNTIENEIMSTTALDSNGTELKTYQGIDKTETIGVELVYKQDYVFDLPIALNLNGTWLNKEIKEHYQNVGKEWIRLPRYRASASATYHVMDNLDSTFSVRYRSNQFGQEDNSDTASNVYGAQDEMTIVNFKTSYAHDLGDYKLKASVGVNNILDEDVWDHHPYPQRTYFANIGLKI